MTDYVPMTREAYNKRRAEIARMENEEMAAIAENIAAARAEGDLSENAEYHAQREAQGMLQAKINKLKTDLAPLRLLTPRRSRRTKLLSAPPSRSETWIWVTKKSSRSWAPVMRTTIWTAI